MGITAIEFAEGEPPMSTLHPMRVLFLIPRNDPPKLSGRIWGKQYKEYDYRKHPISRLHKQE